MSTRDRFSRANPYRFLRGRVVILADPPKKAQAVVSQPDGTPGYDVNRYAYVFEPPQPGHTGRHLLVTRSDLIKPEAA